MAKKNSLDKIKKKLIPLLKEKGVVKAGIFGSYARGEETKSSDIDILVKISKPLGFEFMKIQFEIERRLGKKADLITYKSLNPLLKNRILKEEVRII